MTKSYRQILKDLYEEKKSNNPAYSLVAFSRDAGFKSYHLTDVIKGRYGLSVASATRVAAHLKMPHHLKEEFLNLVLFESARSPYERARAKEKINNLKYQSDKVITDCEFNLISEWYHLAILELAQREDFDGHPEKIALQLDISAAIAREAMKNLESTGLLQKDQQNRYHVDYEVLSVMTKKDNISSMTIQSFHSQMIAKGLATMKSVDISKRFFNSFNVNLTREEYMNLTVEVSSFILKKISFIQKKKIDRSQLYALNLQIFPLEHPFPANKDMHNEK